MPTASSTASRSSICCSRVPGRSSGSDSPVPRRSKITTRANDASRSRPPTKTGSSHLQIQMRGHSADIRDIQRPFTNHPVGNARIANAGVPNRPGATISCGLYPRSDPLPDNISERGAPHRHRRVRGSLVVAKRSAGRSCPRCRRLACSRCRSRPGRALRRGSGLPRCRSRS
jgi:hypothetical protein